VGVRGKRLQGGLQSPQLKMERFVLGTQGLLTCQAGGEFSTQLVVAVLAIPKLFLKRPAAHDTSIVASAAESQ
jgi:hypothetical protein